MYSTLIELKFSHGSEPGSTEVGSTASWCLQLLPRMFAERARRSPQSARLVISPAFHSRDVVARLTMMHFYTVTLTRDTVVL